MSASDFLGDAAFPKSAIIRALRWDSHLRIETAESFIREYEKYSFAYKSKEWILRTPNGDRTLNFGDHIIIGYKDILAISDEEFTKKYHWCTDWQSK